VSSLFKLLLHISEALTLFCNPIMLRAYGEQLISVAIIVEADASSDIEPHDDEFILERLEQALLKREIAIPRNILENIECAPGQEHNSLTTLAIGVAEALNPSWSHGVTLPFWRQNE
jgi:hypothetical protein